MPRRPLLFPHQALALPHLTRQHPHHEEGELGRRFGQHKIGPDKGMAGRTVQGLIDVLEGNYGGDPTKMPYVVNKEAWAPPP